MPWLVRSTLCLLAILVVLSAGCRKQRVDVEKTVQVDPGDIKSTAVEAPSDQQVTVTVSSPGSAVNVYLVLGEEDQVMRALQDGKQPTNVLASKEKVEEATLEAKVPAKKEVAVVLSNASGKSAQVKVKFTGR
jgi:hypothetical protein